MLKPEYAAIRSENDEDEQQAGQVEAQHQVGQRRQRGNPVLADGKGHGAAGAERREFHDGVHHREKSANSLR